MNRIEHLTDPHKKKLMTAEDTWDVFCTLDGFASYDERGDWGGYWGKQGPEFLDRRLAPRWCRQPCAL